MVQDDKLSKLEGGITEDNGAEPEKGISTHKNELGPRPIKQPNVEASKAISNSWISKKRRETEDNSKSESEDVFEGESGATFIEDHVASTSSDSNIDSCKFQVGRKHKKQIKTGDTAKPIPIPTKERLHKCNQCEKSFTKKNNLNQHLKLHVVEKPHKCSHCDKAFIKKCYLEYHMRSHTGDKPYQCSYCDCVFTVRSSLMNHLKRKHTGEKPYNCEHCDKAFTQDAQLRSHLKMLHSVEKPYQCSICEKAFSNDSDLRVHKRIHAGENPYKCNYCGESFSKIGYLTLHVRIHTTDKPYNCSHCTKTFSHNQDLTKHLRIHTNICSQCGKVFRTKRGLLNHQLTHTGEKPYQCDHCDKAFARNDQYKRHLTIHNVEKPFQHASINPIKHIQQESGTNISPHTISDFHENSTIFIKNEVEDNSKSESRDNMLEGEAEATFIEDDHVGSTISDSDMESCEVQMGCKRKRQ